MKRALLIILGILITACFSFYILGENLTGKNIQKAINEEIEISEQTHYLADANPIAPALPIDKGQMQTPEAQSSLQTQKTLAQETPSSDIALAPTLTAALLPAPLPTPKSAPMILNGKWKLVWQDEFDKVSVNLEMWTEVDRKDNYNREKQYYSPLNSGIKDGCLCITAKREEKKGKEYTSGMTQTKDKFSFLYGRIEAAIKLPVGKGFFPAFWLLQNDDENEVDIMEMVGHEPNLIYAVNHYKKSGYLRKTVGMAKVMTPEMFHVYAIEWEEDEIRWYVDDELYHTSNKGVPSEAMYIIFTLAVDGVWPGAPNDDTIFPSSMIIDYVRIYTRI